MKNDEREYLEKQVKEGPKDVLEMIIREGARRMLQAAIENEVSEYIDRFKTETDSQGHRLVVRNGSLPKREIITGIGPLPMKQPRFGIRERGRILPVTFSRGI